MNKLFLLPLALVALAGCGGDSTSDPGKGERNFAFSIGKVGKICPDNKVRFPLVVDGGGHGYTTGIIAVCGDGKTMMAYEDDGGAPGGTEKKALRVLQSALKRCPSGIDNAVSINNGGHGYITGIAVRCIGKSDYFALGV